MMLQRAIISQEQGGDLVSIVIKKGLYSNKENKKPRTKLTKGIEIDISCHIWLHDYSTTMVQIQNINFEGLVAYNTIREICLKYLFKASAIPPATRFSQPQYLCFLQPHVLLALSFYALYHSFIFINTKKVWSVPLSLSLHKLKSPKHTHGSSISCNKTPNSSYF